MMSVSKTSNCSNQRNCNNLNLINKKTSKISTLSIKLLKPIESILTSRIPVSIQRYSSPGPYRRSTVSQHLRNNNRRSSSLTNSPIPKPKTTNKQYTNNYYGQQQKGSASIKMATENVSPTSKLQKKNDEKNDYSDSCSPINEMFSKKNTIVTMTTQIDNTAPTNPKELISGKDTKCSNDDDMTSKKSENKIATTTEEIVNRADCIKNGCYVSATNLLNGQISPILEEVNINDVIEKRNTNGMTLNLNGSLTKTKQGNSQIINGCKVRTPKTPHTPRTPLTPSGSSSNPINGAVSNKLTPKTPPVTPDSYNTYFDDDLDSLYSYSSGRSTMSCDHPYVARNGTTFSGRKMKYVVHCSSHAGQVGLDYLTPTQRAQKQLRRLKEILSQARQDLEQKDSELCRLTREVVELRLFKASLSSPEDRSNSSDAVTVREAPTDLKTSQDVSPIVDDISKLSPRHTLHSIAHLNSEMQNSFADSGHFEDMTTSSINSSSTSTHDHQTSNVCGITANSYEEQRAELIKIYEKKIEELIKIQDATTNDTKQSHNDRVEALLQKLAECNTRYADIVPDYEQAKEKIRELEKQMDDLQYKLLEQEDKQKKMYLHMYTKGQEAEKVAHAEQIMEIAHRAPNRVSVPELLQQLQSTQDELENIRVANSRERVGDCALLTAKEAISLWVLGARKTIYRRLMEAQNSKTKVDPEVTLQFLKSAIYYFLTDKENSQGHLKAIESILEFTEQEKLNISKARASK